jgi:hypothetical protein
MRDCQTFLKIFFITVHHESGATGGGKVKLHIQLSCRLTCLAPGHETDMGMPFLYGQKKTSRSWFCNVY